MRLNNFVVLLQLPLNPASQRRMWKKRLANQIHPLNIFPPLKVHFQTCCPARQLSTMTSNLQTSLLFSFFFYCSADSPETITFARRCCDCCCRPLSRSPARVRGKVPCLWAPRQHFQAVWREAFHDGCRQTWAELQTLHTTDHTMSIILRRYATFESLLVVKGADSGRNSLFVCLFGVRDGNGKRWGWRKLYLL